MSNPCRRFHTTFGSGSTKPLIRLVDGAVAEGRQPPGRWALSDIGRGCCRGRGRSPVVSATRVRSRRARIPGNRDVRETCSAGAGCTDGWQHRRAGNLLNSAFYNAYCRSFSTLHRRSNLSYTPPEISLRLSMNGSIPSAGAG